MTQNMNVEVKKGYFVQCIDDLYAGLCYYGVFENENKANDFAVNAKKPKKYGNGNGNYDEVNVLFLPYIEFEHKIFALWGDSAVLIIP